MVCCSKHWITKLKSLFHKENWLVDMKRSLRYHLYNIKATMAGESTGNIPRLNDRPIWFLCFFSSFPSLLCSYLSIFFLKKKKNQLHLLNFLPLQSVHYIILLVLSLVLTSFIYLFYFHSSTRPIPFYPSFFFFLSFQLLFPKIVCISFKI